MEPPPQSCLHWAMMGEKAYRAGNVLQGVKYLEKAVEIGTDDLRTLGAIYSQLGSAYTELGEFEKALNYLSYDHILTKSQKDREGEAKSVSNISNLYKLQHNYDQAIKFAQLQLDIGKELENQVTQAAAHYNLGTIFFLRGKGTAKILKAATSAMNVTVSSSRSTGCNFHEDIGKAIDSFNANLSIVEAVNDRKACGRAYGNLGNCYYLIRDFEEAVKHHTKRLEVAQEYGDKETQRKAYLNLASAYFFLGDSMKSVECNRLALSLAMELDPKILRNKAVQGQSSKMKDDDFFEFLGRMQSSRLDDQRCEAPMLTDAANRAPRQRDTNIPSPNESFTSASSSKSRGILSRVASSLMNSATPLHKHFSTATLFSRKKKQRDTMSVSSFEGDLLGGRNITGCTEAINKLADAITNSDDDLTDLVCRMERTRFNEQRAHLP